MPVVDVHAHLETRELEVDALLHKMDVAGIDRVVLIPTMNDVLPETPRALLALLRTLLRTPLHPLGRRLNAAFYTPEGHLKLRGHVYRIYSLPDNALLAQAIAANPDRFLGWIFLNPRVMDDPVEELERWRQVPGFLGVKLHPHWHHYPLEAALPIARRCEDLGLPMLIHLGFGDAGNWQLLANQCPDLKLVFAHAGMPHFDRMWDAMRKRPNLYIDVSSPYLSENLVRAAIAAVGPERALYGTDAPYGFHEHDGSYDYLHIKGWIYRLPCRARDVDAILGDNAMRLLAEKR